jgi:NADH:ubiquinone oxidoreductase subunit 4 (subunit M)
MLLSSLIALPVIGITIITSLSAYDSKSKHLGKLIALATSVLNMIISLLIFILFHNSTNYFQYVEQHFNLQYFDIYLGIDGISIYFVLLTTIIIPISLLSN